MAHQIHPAAEENGASGFQSESSDDCHSFDSESSPSLKVDGGSNGAGMDTVDTLPATTSFMRGWYEKILRFVPQLKAINVTNGNSSRLNYMPVKKNSEEYKMTHETIGKAVIFSFSKWNKRKSLYRVKPLPHYFFTEKSPKPIALDRASRERLKRDEDILMDVLNNTGFVVERYHNLKSDAFHEKLQSLRSEDHWESDCLLVIILTHGGNNTLFLSDRTQFPVHCLWTEYFEAHKCPSLAAKPKIFLVQALSDSNDDEVDEVNGNDDFADASILRESFEDKEDCGNFSYSIPNAADIIVAFTYPTASSVERGSSLTLNFAQILRQYAFEYDINQIFTLVSNAMKHNDAQHLVILSTLIRQLKFRQKQIYRQETGDLIDQSTRDIPQINRDTHYNVNTSRRGKAIVFNFHKFQKVHGAVAQKNRDGSKKDLEDLRKLFEGMNFDFVPHSDLSNYRFTAELKKIRNEDHSDAECLVVVVMTHGEKNRLVMADHAQFPIHFVWKYFEDHACPSLKGKPKIFIIQACRGNEFDNGTFVSYVGEDLSSSANSYIDSTSLSCIKPMSPDIFVAYSTPFGKFSLRNAEKGSWFIQEVVKVLSNYHSSMDIHGLFTTVARNVAINYASSSSTNTAMANKKQVPCITSTLTKTYIFSNRTVESTDQQ